MKSITIMQKFEIGEKVVCLDPRGIEPTWYTVQSIRIYLYKDGTSYMYVVRNEGNFSSCNRELKEDDLANEHDLIELRQVLQFVRQYVSTGAFQVRLPYYANRIRDDLATIDNLIGTLAEGVANGDTDNQANEPG